MDKYRSQYGKLVFNLSIPVDERMKRLAEKAKASQVRFNEWARDKLYQAIHEIEQTLEEATEAE